MQHERSSLRRLLAERDLELDALRALIADRMQRSPLRRAAVGFLKERGLSERRSCVLIGLSRSGLRYTVCCRLRSAGLQSACVRSCKPYARPVRIDKPV